MECRPIVDAHRKNQGKSYDKPLNTLPAVECFANYIIADYAFAQRFDAYALTLQAPQIAS